MGQKWSPKWTQIGAQNGAQNGPEMEPEMDPEWRQESDHFPAPLWIHFGHHFGAQFGPRLDRLFDTISVSGKWSLSGTEGDPFWIPFPPRKVALSSTRKWSHASAGLLPVWRQESGHFPAQESRHFPMRFWCPFGARKVTTFHGHFAALAGARYPSRKVVSCSGRFRCPQVTTFQSPQVTTFSRGKVATRFFQVVTLLES